MEANKPENMENMSMEKKDKKETCVEFNVFVECDERRDPPKPCEMKKDKKKDDSCVTINVFVDCGKEKHKYSF